MCYMLYLASEKALPEIQAPDWALLDFDTHDWVTKAPRLVVASLTDMNHDVRVHFSEQNVVSVGSYEGCGCGFNYCSDNLLIEPDVSGEDKFALVATESRAALAEYIRKNGVTSLVGCWAGDEGLSLVAEMNVTGSQLQDVRFQLPERVRMNIAS
jgi:hypothetical protein